MFDVSEATSCEIDQLVELEAALFVEDAGRHDPFSDTTWPSREGREDFENLMASPDCIVLAGRRSGDLVGLLAGCAQKSSPTRQPVEYVVLRSMYVAERARVQTAMASGEVLRLSVVVANGGSGPVDLLLNCRAATSVVLTESTKPLS